MRAVLGLLVDTAAAQVADVLAFAQHGRGIAVVQLVLLGLPDQLAGQVQEELLHVVRLLGRGLKVHHALGLGKVLRPVSMHLPLLRQVDLVTCWGQ